MNDNKNKTIILVRVSTKEQEETGYSLPAQEKLLNEYAGKKSLTVAKIFSISESASGKKQRETFNEMMSFVKRNNIKIIICEKVDRLTRNFKDAVMIDEWLEQDDEREVHLVKDSLILHKNSRSQEKLNWGIRILFAKNYTDNLSEEVKKGQKEKVAQGWLPTVPPLGYKTVGEKGHKIHVIDEVKAPLVRKMFKLYSTGNYSLEKITNIMFADGLRSRSNKKLGKSTLHELLNNPFYFGKFIWNGKIYQGAHQALISEELFEKVQSILHKKGTPKYSKHNFFFKGLLTCSECGGTIAWEKKKGHWYGHCNKFKPCSQKAYYRSERIEEQLLTAVGKISPKSPKLIDWVIKALKQSHKEEIEYHTGIMGELESRLAKIKARLDKIYEDKLDEVISIEKYNQLKQQYEIEEAAILKAISKHKKANSRYLDYGVMVLEVTKNALDILKDPKKSPETKREYYKIIFSKLQMTGDLIDYRFNSAFKRIAEFSSKLEKIEQSEIKNLEPLILRLPKNKTGVLSPVCSAMLPGPDSNRRPIG